MIRVEIDIFLKFLNGQYQRKQIYYFKEVGMLPSSTPSVSTPLAVMEVALDSLKTYDYTKPVGYNRIGKRFFYFRLEQEVIPSILKDE